MFSPRASLSVRSEDSSGDEKGRPWNSIQDPFSDPVWGYIIILTREGWGTSTHPPYFEHCTGAPSPNGASASAPVPFRRRAGPPPPPAHRPLTENRQLYFEPGCIQDPFSDPFARALPSLSPSGLPRGRPFPSVPSPLSTGSSPPSPPPRDLSLSFTHTRQLSALA